MSPVESVAPGCESAVTRSTWTLATSYCATFLYFATYLFSFFAPSRPVSSPHAVAPETVHS